MTETQFATELVVAGVRRLCTVPIQSSWLMGHDQTYPLHLGLHGYTSGLERLCKLTIACHGFVTTGTFPPLRSFGHKISDLLLAVERLDLSEVPQRYLKPVGRPADELDPDLTVALERFAGGAGRYEHLDSLWNDRAAVTTLDSWTRLCAQVTVSERVRYLVSVRTAVVTALRTLCTEGDLEASGFGLVDPVGPPLSEASIEVALHLYNKASWVASRLHFLTYYTHEDLPLLGEAVADIKQPAEKFFQYSVAQIDDEHAVVDELEAHFKRFPDGEDDE